MFAHCGWRVQARVFVCNSKAQRFANVGRLLPTTTLAVLNGSLIVVFVTRGARIMQGQPQPQTAKVPYVCGSCGVDLNLKLNDTVQCTECGGRILYKKRTRQIVQFEAR